MAPGNLFGRLMQYLANEVVVKTLANSPTFQRFAVRSSQQMKDFSKNAAATARTIADNPSLNEARKEAAQVRNDASFVLGLANNPISLDYHYSMT